MAYTKVNWQDLPITATPRNATNLGHMDDGIENNDKRLDGTIPAGNMIVDSVRSKNMFNPDRIVKHTGTIAKKLTTGVRVQLKTNAQDMWTTFELPDSIMGKTITISSTITPSASNNGKIAFFFGNDTYDPVDYIGELSQTGQTTLNIPSSLPSNTSKILALLYANANGTGVYDDYVDYTNLQLEIGSTKTDFTSYQQLGNDDFITGTNIGNFGTFEGTQVSGWDDNILLTKSFIGSIQVNGTWYVLINIRHRNGLDDGTNFGVQIMTPMLSEDIVQIRNQVNGLWGNWRTL